MNVFRIIGPLLCFLLAGASVPTADAGPVASPAVPKPGLTKGDANGKDKTFLVQSSVAAKAAFGTIPVASPAVKKALGAHAIAAAQKQIGQAGAFQGTVSKVYVSHGNGIVILNFAPNYHSALAAVVKPEAYAKFPDLMGLTGKRVLIQGKFVAYHGSPEVELTSPAQVKVITGK